MSEFFCDLQSVEMQPGYSEAVANICDLFHADFVRNVREVPDALRAMCFASNPDDITIALDRSESLGETEGQLQIGIASGKGAATPDDIQVALLGPAVTRELIGQLDKAKRQIVYLVAYKARWLMLDRTIDRLHSDPDVLSRLIQRREMLLERYESVVASLQ